LQATRVLARVRVLRTVWPWLGGSELDLWLIALRADRDPATRQQLEERLGIRKGLLGPRMHRWLADPAIAGCVTHHRETNAYSLTGVGARRADDRVLAYRRAFVAARLMP
jgi:hypothetical protein